MDYKSLIRMYFTSLDSISFINALTGLFNHYRKYTLLFDKIDTDVDLVPSDVIDMLPQLNIEFLEDLLHLENGDYSLLREKTLDLLRGIRYLGLQKYYSVLSELMFDSLPFNDKIEALLLMEPMLYECDLSSLTKEQVIYLAQNISRFELDSKLYIFTTRETENVSIFYEHLTIRTINCLVDCSILDPTVTYGYIKVDVKMQVKCHRLRLSLFKIEWDYIRRSEFEELELVNCTYDTIPDEFKPKIRTLIDADKIPISEADYPSIINTTHPVIFTNIENDYFEEYTITDSTYAKNLPTRITKLTIKCSMDLSIFDGFYFETLILSQKCTFSNPLTKIKVNKLSIEGNFTGHGFVLDQIFELDAFYCRVIPPYVQKLTMLIPIKDSNLVSDYLIDLMLTGNVSASIKHIVQSSSLYKLHLTNVFLDDTSYLPNLKSVYIYDSLGMYTALFTSDYILRVMSTVENMSCEFEYGYADERLELNLDLIPDDLKNIDLTVAHIAGSDFTLEVLPTPDDPRFKKFDITENTYEEPDEIDY